MDSSKPTDDFFRSRFDGDTLSRRKGRFGEIQMRTWYASPKAGIAIGVLVVVLAGIGWFVFGPGSTERTVLFASVARVDSAAGGSTVHFLAPRYPDECADAESNGLGLVAHSDVSRIGACQPNALGEVLLRVGRTGCELLSFTPRDYGAYAPQR